MSQYHSQFRDLMTKHLQSNTYDLESLLFIYSQQILGGTRIGLSQSQDHFEISFHFYSLPKRKFH